MPPRVLILSAAVGAGHTRAAQALEAAIGELNPGGIVRHIDVLTLTNALFRRVYGMTYLDLVNHAPHVLGYIYDALDKPRSARSPQDRLRVMLQKMNMSRFLELLACEPWDVIVSTHFLPAEIIAHLRKKRLLHTPQVTVTTDFDTHRMWVNQPCEKYTCATDEAAVYLHSYGVPSEHTIVTGIPIHPVFATAKDSGEISKAYGLANDRPVVLHMSGGFGLGPVAKLYKGILECQTPLQVIAVTGRNAKVKKQLDGMEVPRRHRATIFGFTDKIDELMAVADIVVSKPGGLTTSEVLARGAIMAIINPIPGQESRNSDYLLECGAAIKINNVPTIPMKLDRLLNDKAKLEALKKNVKRIARPRSAYDAAQVVLGCARTCRD